ncbi:MAG TPA: outer membrane protein transport protein [Chitinophagaceae bacterium]|nr:outer membrane protein transport protein [Chitinophagaceae bacterium]
MKQKYAVMATAIVLLLISQSFAQNGTRLIAFDAKTAGRGGTSTGFFDNPSLMMNNPAGLSFLKSSQLDLSVSLMAPTVHFTNEINNTDGKRNIFPLGCIDYAHSSPQKLSYAVGLFTQGGMGADFELNHALYRMQTRAYVPQTYHSKFAVMQAGGSVAYKLSPTISFGVSAMLVYGQVEFQMPMAMSPSALRGVIDPQTGFTFGDLFSASSESGGLGYTELITSATMKELTAYGFNGKIGIAFKPNDKFSAGINYTLPVSMNYDNGNATMDMSYQLNDAFAKVVAGIMQQQPNLSPDQAQAAAIAQFAQLGIDLSKGVTDHYSASAKFGLPQSLSVGIFFASSKKIRLGLDAEWITWKNAFDQMDISLANGTNSNINRMTASEGNIKMAFPLKWKNSIVVRTGGELDISRALTLRTGYAFGSNPVAGSTIFPVFPAIVEHHATIGGSLKVSHACIINAAYEHAFRNSETSDPKNLIGNEYNNSTSSIANDIFHLSLSWFL